MPRQVSKPTYSHLRVDVEGILTAVACFLICVWLVLFAVWVAVKT